jgi:hypothetical protein
MILATGIALDWFEMKVGQGIDNIETGELTPNYLNRRESARFQWN